MNRTNLFWFSGCWRQLPTGVRAERREAVVLLTLWRSMDKLALVSSGHPRSSRHIFPFSISRCRMSRPARTWPTRSHQPCAADSSRKRRLPSAAFEKRRKEYFFKLLSAARNRDKSLLLAVMKALGQDADYMQTKSVLGTSNPIHLEDVLLKAASRCGQTSLADTLFKVA